MNDYEINQLRERVGRQADAITSLQAAYGQVSKRCAELEERIEALESENRSLSDNMASLHKRQLTMLRSGKEVIA